MIQINGSLQFSDITALQHLARGLEVRFPEHNGVFEYMTRLAEEVGELIEVIDETKGEILNDSLKTHLAGEQIDVIRTVLGIAEIYNIADDLPKNFDDYTSVGDPVNRNDYITRLAVACGELANAVNHAEGMGIKAKKHGDGAKLRVFDRAQAVIRAVIWTARFYDAENELREDIVSRYHHDSKQGYIPSSPHDQRL